MQYSAKENFNFSVAKTHTRIYSYIAKSKWKITSFSTYCKSITKLLQPLTALFEFIHWATKFLL